MPVPLPRQEDIDLLPRRAEEAFATAEAIASAVAPPGGLTPVQRVLLEALYPAMTGHAIDTTRFQPVGTERLGEVLAHRNPGFRARGVQVNAGLGT